MIFSAKNRRFWYWRLIDCFFTTHNLDHHPRLYSINWRLFFSVKLLTSAKSSSFQLVGNLWKCVRSRETRWKKRELCNFFLPNLDVSKIVIKLNWVLHSSWSIKYNLCVLFLTKRFANRSVFLIVPVQRALEGVSSTWFRKSLMY